MSFDSVKFGAGANFVHATFGGDAHFIGTGFTGTADFIAARFIGRAYFHQAKFGANAQFDSSEFDQDASFNYAHFSAPATFRKTTFNKGGSFIGVVVNDSLSFSGSTNERRLKNDACIPARALGENPSLAFQHARIEKPELVSFHTVSLRPHWFINIDSSKFDFVNVEWRGGLHEPLESLLSDGVPSPHRLLSIAYRQLAVNAEENHRYDEASNFRYWSMAARRGEEWHESALWRRWLRWSSERSHRLSQLRIILFLRKDRLNWSYWILSGYGERVFRGLVALVGIWLVFAWLYTYVGFARWTPKATTEVEAAAASYDEVGEPLRFTRALSYSLRVMSLQKPEPSPATTAAQTLVVIETIFGPVQVALLALAIRRKFMR